VRTPRQYPGEGRRRTDHDHEFVLHKLHSLDVYC
jgi:hypothetical protein